MDKTSWDALPGAGSGPPLETGTRPYKHLDELYASADRNIDKFRDAGLTDLEMRWRMFKRGVDSAVAALNRDEGTNAHPRKDQP